MTTHTLNLVTSVTLNLNIQT